MSDSKYAVAVKSSQFNEVPKDWKSQIQKIEGVNIDDELYESIIRVSATDEGISKLESIFGDYLIVEHTIAHIRQPADKCRDIWSATSVAAGDEQAETPTVAPVVKDNIEVAEDIAIGERDEFTDISGTD